MLSNSKGLLLILSTVYASYTYASDRSFEYQGRTYSYDDAMKMEKPPAGMVPVIGVSECEDSVEKIIGVPFRVFELLTQHEGGKHGIAVHSVSKDGRYRSWDVGKYQINEVNWAQYSGMYKMTPFHLRWNDCSNLVAAAYRMKPYYKKAIVAFKRFYGAGNIDAAMDQALYELSGYTSETPEIRLNYSIRLKAHVMRYILEGRTITLW